MAAEEPMVGFDREFGADRALAVGTPLFRNIGDLVEHQQRRQRQLRIAGPEQVATPASNQIFIIVTGASLHRAFSFFVLAPKAAQRRGAKFAASNIGRSSEEAARNSVPHRIPCSIQRRCSRLLRTPGYGSRRAS